MLGRVVSDPRTGSRCCNPGSRLSSSALHFNGSLGFAAQNKLVLSNFLSGV